MNKIIVSLVAILCFSTVSFAETTQSNDKTLKTLAIIAGGVTLLGTSGLAVYFGVENNKLSKDNTNKEKTIKTLTEARNNYIALYTDQQDALNKLQVEKAELESIQLYNNAVLNKLEVIHPNNLKSIKDAVLTEFKAAAEEEKAKAKKS